MSGVPAVATGIAVQVSQGLIELQGWRAAYRILAVAAAVVTIPACLLLVREPPFQNAPGQTRIDVSGLSGPEAFRSRDFLLTIGASCLAVGTLMGVTNHFLAWMAERGVSKDAATLALSLYSLAGPLGPLVGGILVDRVPSSKVVAGFFALAPAGMVLLGLAFSSINGFAPYLVSRYFGMKAASEILAVTFAAMTVGMGIGPVLVGLGHDLSGGYGNPMTFAAGGALLALAAALLFQPYRFGAFPRP